MTLFDQLIGDSDIIATTKLTGPNGGAGWTKYTLDDGRVALRGPTVGYLYHWLKQLAPAGQYFIRAGGTTYAWSGWISTRGGNVNIPVPLGPPKPQARRQGASGTA